MKMDINEFQEELSAILDPEPDEDGDVLREFPHSRLERYHGLGFEYLETGWDWEGSTTHPFTRLCPEDEERVRALTRNRDVPEKLFGSALRLIADSVIAYHDLSDRKGELRFYPSVILTFWAGFESFVRRLSEMMIATVQEIPGPVANFLQEREFVVDAKGSVSERPRFQPVLDRYAVLLSIGYGFHVERGKQYWQNLVEAKRLRDYYTHVDVREPRSVTSLEVLNFTESVLLGIIWPSSILQKTLLLDVFRLYELWELLSRYHEPFEERPLLLDFQLDEPYLFHCNFENVDSTRFPSMRDLLRQDGE